MQRLQRAAEASTSTQGEGEGLPPEWTPYAAFPGPGLVRWPASLEHWKHTCPAVARACAIGLVQVVLRTRGAARLLSPADMGPQEGRALEPADLQRLAQHLDVSELLALFVHPRLALGLSERDFTEVLALLDCHGDSKAALHKGHYRQNTLSRTDRLCSACMRP